MTIVAVQRADNGSLVEMVDRLRKFEIEVVAHAEEGSVGAYHLIVDDPTATFSISGHRKIYLKETEAAGDDHGGVFAVGYTGIRTIGRLGEWTEVGRRWRLEMFDLNTVFSRRIMLGPDAKRPDETDVQRAQWLAATNEMNLVDAYTYLSTDNPVPMEKADLRRQSVMQIWDDLAEQSGKNWFLMWFPLGPPDPTSGYTLWYGHAPSEEDLFTSDYRISNYLSDIDQETDTPTTFAAAYETTLEQDPSRVISRAIVQYDGGFAVVTRPETAQAYALGGRDATFHAPNVKRAPAALRRGNRILRDLKNDEEVVKTAIRVPLALVNCIVPGHRIQHRYSHLPGLEDWTWGRVLNRTVRHVNLTQYELALEIATSPAGPGAPTAGVYAELHRPGTHGTSLNWYGGTGDNPKAGWAPAPTQGPITILQSMDPPNQHWPWYGFRVDGDGTIDVRYDASTIGVLPAGDGTYHTTFAIQKNGVTVASEVVVTVRPPSTRRYSERATVTITGLAVENGDVITGHASASPAIAFFRVPAGTGRMAEGLFITGGSLA